MKFTIAAMNLIVVISSLLCLSSNVSLANGYSGVNFSYSSSSGWQNIAFHGSAKISNGTLQLTTPSDSCGWATYGTKISLVDKDTYEPVSFITHFSFIINNTHYQDNNQSDGLAFFLSADAQPANSCGGNLGLFSEPFYIYSPHNHTVAVEFDTNYNDQWDPYFDHVGIDINSIYSIVVYNYSDNIMASGILAMHGSVTAVWMKPSMCF